VERVEVIVAKKRHGKHVSAAADTDATVEHAIFSLGQFLDKDEVYTFRSNKATRNEINCCKQLQLRSHCSFRRTSLIAVYRIFVHVSSKKWARRTLGVWGVSFICIYLVMSPRWGSTPRQTDWLTVSRNVTLTLCHKVLSCPHISQYIYIYIKMIRPKHLVFI
jgi:hypothetical protein